MIVAVTGGAGYIGAHVVRALAAAGHTPIILDDLRSSKQDRCRGFVLEQVSIEQTARVLEVFEKYQPEAVVHLAGSISVAESVQFPDRYWENNLAAGASLLLACSRASVKTLVYSSTAAVYGSVGLDHIHEDCPLAPSSPYGASKLAFERLMHQSAAALGIRSVALRFFNAAGAHPDWRVGEAHDPEEHLIPRVIKAMLEDRPVQIYGSDYETHDGTCVRDYIHVLDLAQAHVLALSGRPGPGGTSFNVGTGRGYSVREVIHAVAACLQVTPTIELLPRRPGDPEQLVADPSALSSRFGWQPTHSDIKEIVESAVAWERYRRARGHRRHERSAAVTPSPVVPFV